MAATAARAARGFGKAVKWAILAAAGLIVVGVVIAIVGVGKGVHDANKTAARVAPLMGQVHLGANEASVKALLGKPDSTQSDVSSLGRTDYWYYGTLASKQSFQLVFENGRLRAKNSY
jgi:hypothetical protein